ncbi:MAG: bifunctional methylenetetrahydrofolate dehydrogenase/methenyltetrahydrofolate cyclohydrolase FolD [Chlamydiia bacterium]|nr:bifunctional methylenetetrahydrofolate dehydrogenase/methenyltetrahydrofolate cyclohydrolase FolD [Chlamydiia bacterium]
MPLIDGKKIAAEIRLELKEKIENLTGRKPGLAFVLIGEDPASEAYVKMKQKGCKEVGIHSKTLELSASITEEDLVSEIKKLNTDETIDGILIQQPFPKHISTEKIVETIDPAKDVDGFHPMNIGRLLLGEPGGFAACTPLGIVTLLKKCQIETKGKHAVIVGRSNIVGKPLAALLMQKGIDCTVTLAHSCTKKMQDICKEGDILIAAVGKPLFVNKDMVKEGAVVIDVGINRTENGLVGDVDFEGVKDIAGAITPVPGGVGPMTIALLLQNTFDSFLKRCSS